MSQIHTTYNMYCNKCGKEIADDSKFCQYCGMEQSGNTKKKVVIEIPEIEIKSNIKLKQETKILLILYFLWLLCWIIYFVNEDSENYLLLLFQILFPLLSYNLLRIWNWIFK